MAYASSLKLQQKYFEQIIKKLQISEKCMACLSFFDIFVCVCIN